MAVKCCRRITAVGSLALVTSLLAACGSSSNQTGSSSNSSSSAATSNSASAAATPAFDSPESRLPAAFPTPIVKKGVPFTLGYLSDQAGVGTLDATQAGAAAEVKALGGKMIADSINADPATQAADFKTLLAQHVTAIALQPVNPPSLTPLIKQAVAAGVPVVTTNAPAVPGPPLPGYVTDVMNGIDRCAYLNVEAVAQAKPHATYALIPSGLPAPALEDIMSRTKYWASRFGLQYVGSVSTGQAVGAPEGSTAMSAIIAQHPTVNSVFTYYDAVAEGAATTQKTRAGGHIMVVGLSGDTAAVQQIRQGTMFSTCAGPYQEVGKQIAIAAYEAVTHQHGTLPKEIAIPSYEITKGNGRSGYASLG